MSKVPRAYFEVACTQDVRPYDPPGMWLAHATVARLQSKFGQSKIVKKWFVPHWVIEVEISGRSFVLFLRVRQHNQWMLLLLRPDESGFFDRLLDRRVLDCSTELKSIAHEVHMLLTEVPNLSGLRWYFDGSTSSVATPEELSWA